MANTSKVDNNDDLLYHCIPRSECNHPWLVITHGDEYERHTFYSVSEDKCFNKEIPEMQNKRISQASYGWLLMIDDDGDGDNEEGEVVELDCCLLNPQTMEKIQLPRVENYGCYNCVLSRPPTESDCHVLLVGASLFFCQVGDSKFIERPREIGGDYLDTATNFQGQIFAWMGERRGIVTVDFVIEGLKIKNLVKKNGQPCQFPYIINTNPEMAISNHHLIVSCGELLLVSLIGCESHMTKVSSYKIFRINMTDLEWQELHSIGNRAIFLSRYGGMAVLLPSTETRVEKDAIYYISITDDERNLYVYHIEDRSQTLLIPCHEVDGAHSLKSWIMI